MNSKNESRIFENFSYNDLNQTSFYTNYNIICLSAVCIEQKQYILLFSMLQVDSRLRVKQNKIYTFSF